MTRAEIACKLLALGPLTPTEFREITGWKGKEPSYVLHNLRRRRQAVRVPVAGQREPVYRLLTAVGGDQ